MCLKLSLLLKVLFKLLKIVFLTRFFLFHISINFLLLLPNLLTLTFSLLSCLWSIFSCSRLRLRLFLLLRLLLLGWGTSFLRWLAAEWTHLSLADDRSPGNARTLQWECISHLTLPGKVSLEISSHCLHQCLVETLRSTLLFRQSTLLEFANLVAPIKSVVSHVASLCVACCWYECACLFRSVMHSGTIQGWCL